MPHSIYKEIGQIVLGGLLSLGSHEGGHVLKANALNEPIKFNGLSWTTPASGKDLGRIASAGFELQSLLSNAMPMTNVGNKYRVLSGLHMLGRAIEPRKPFGVGDMDSVKRAFNENTTDVARGAMAITGISHMLKAFGKGLPDNQDLRFWTSDTGAPGLMYTRRF